MSYTLLILICFPPPTAFLHASSSSLPAHSLSSPSYFQPWFSLVLSVCLGIHAHTWVFVGVSSQGFLCVCLSSPKRSTVIADVGYCIWLFSRPCCTRVCFWGFELRSLCSRIKCSHIESSPQHSNLNFTDTCIRLSYFLPPLRSLSPLQEAVSTHEYIHAHTHICNFKSRF